MEEDGSGKRLAPGAVGVACGVVRDGDAAPRQGGADMSCLIESRFTANRTSLHMIRPLFMSMSRGQLPMANS